MPPNSRESNGVELCGQNKSPGLLLARLRERPVLLTIGLAFAIFVIDAALPLGVAGGVPYVAVILVALNVPAPRFVVGTAMACSVLTLLDILISAGPGGTEWWKVIVNRGLALFAIWVTTLLGLQRNRADAERRRHLDELAHLNRVQTVEQLATAMAHELNQPLAALSLHSEVAARLMEQFAPRDESPSATDLRSSLREITQQSQRASEILRTLRRLVRKGLSSRAEVSINDVIRDVRRWFEPIVHQAGIDLRCELAQQLPAVIVDRVQIEQVLLNLLRNASDALSGSKPDQRIIIETRTDPIGVRVVVRDSGLGVPLEQRDRLFESFATTKPNGMGLGLALSRSIIEAHGGRLWLETDSSATPQMSGATFVFTLPRNCD